MGYKHYHTSKGWKDLDLRYANETDEQIRFCYWEGDWGAQVQAEMEEAVYSLESETVEINGFPAELYMGVDGINHLFWPVEDVDGAYWITGPAVATANPDKYSISSSSFAIGTAP